MLLFTTASQSESHYLAQVKRVQGEGSEIEEAIKKVEEHKPITVTKPLKVPPFHYRYDSESPVYREFCVTCHTALPHTKSERLRSYLNMHVNYLACTSCHYRPEKVVIAYRWTQWESNQKDNQKPISLITPFTQQEAVTLSEHHPEIRDFLLQWEKSEIGKQAEVHLKLHAPLENSGLECLECHTSDNPVLDYKALGYKEEEIKSLSENRIARMLGEEKFKDKPIKLMDLLR
jgi:RNase P subunit RPR2